MKINLDKMYKINIYILLLSYIIVLGLGYAWCYLAFDLHQKKTRQLIGKYIRHENAPLEVMNQWDIGGDSVAYSTFNQDTALRFYKNYGCNDEVIEELGGTVNDTPE